MATLANLEDQVDAALAAAGWTTTLGWAEKPVRVESGAHRAWTQVRRSELVITGSNQSVRTAEVVTTFARRSLAPATDITEAAILGDLSAYTDPRWWSALAAVRESPIPEVEVEREPERVGQVLVMALRVRVALEG